MTAVDVRSLVTRTWIQCSAGTLLNADPLLVGINLEDTSAELAQRMTLDLRQTKVEQARGEWISELAGLGSRIYHLTSQDGGKTFTSIYEGSCTDWELDPDGETLSLTFHDPLFEFASHEDQVSYPEGISGKDVITDLFEAYGFPRGDIAGPDVPMPRIVFDGAMGQLLMQVLQHGLYSGDKAYLPRWLPGSPTEPGRVAIVAPGLNDPVYSFDRGNLLAARERQSSESMVSSVWLVGNESAESDDARPPIEQRITVPTGDPRPKVGRRVLVKSADYDSPESAKKAAQTLLERSREPDRDRSATVIDVPGVVKGDVVRLRGGTFDGFYTILSVSHDEDARTMALQVGDRGSALYQAQKFPDPPAPPADLYGAIDTGGGANCATDKLMAWFDAHLGIPYAWGGGPPVTTAAAGTDCSGFAASAFNATVGVNFGWGSTDSMLTDGAAFDVPLDQRQPGDLILFERRDFGSVVSGHVAVVARNVNQQYESAGPPSALVPLDTGRGIVAVRRVRALVAANAACAEAAAAQAAASGGGTADGSGVTSKFGPVPEPLASLIAEFFPRSEWTNAANVAYLESTWNSGAGKDDAIESSYGYFQINIDAWGGSAAHWKNARNNVAKAYAIWSDGQYWGTTAKWFHSANTLGLR